MSFDVQVITDSKCDWGHRLTTVKATFPRYLLAEFNTHKMISKNSASSRAIPAVKLIESVRKNPYIPEKWMKDHKGMQGTEYFNDPIAIEVNRNFWQNAIDVNTALSWDLNGEGRGVSKQISNRLLEPFMYHTTLMSATEWENFFALRAHGAAEDNFQKTAFMILDAINISEPKLLKEGEWHLPFIDKDITEEDWNEIGKDMSLIEVVSMGKEGKSRVSSAKCAGISYVIVGEDGKEESYTKLLKRFTSLSTNGHWSPMEHPARVMYEREYFNCTKSFIISRTEYETSYEPNHVRGEHTYTADFTTMEEFSQVKITEYGWLGNYRGFQQYRKMFPNENRTDSRLIRK